MLNSLAKQGWSEVLASSLVLPFLAWPHATTNPQLSWVWETLLPRWGSWAGGGHGVSTTAVAAAAAGWCRVRGRRSVRRALAFYCRVIGLPVLYQWHQPPQASHPTASPSLSPLGEGTSLAVTDRASPSTCGACSQRVPSLSICSCSFSPRWRLFWWLIAIHCSACETPTQAVIWVLSYAQLEPLGDDTLSN